MENRVNYIAVGLFVFILGCSTVGFVLWLGKYAQNENFSHFKVVTAQSVSGLNPKAPVKLMGVSVGEVEDIYISKDNSEEVIILIRVQESTPIKKDTYALINLQGITGLSYIDLEGGSHGSQLLKTDDKSYGVIETKASMMKRLDDSLTMISKKTEKMLDKVDAVLSRKNLKNFEMALNNFAEATASMDKTLIMINKKDNQINDVLEKAKEFEEAVAEASYEVSQASADIKEASHKTFTSMTEASDVTARVMLQLENKLQEGKLDIDMIVRENLLPFQNDLNDLRALVIESREFMSELRDSPSDLLFKKSDIERAPSEEGER